MNDELKINCFIPIEIKARELNSKLLLAKKLIENGFRVYIGEKSIIDKFIKLSKIKKNGIYFYKSGSFSKKKKFIIDSCENIVVLDEELGVSVKDLEGAYFTRTISHEVIDKYFVLGKKHKEAVVNVRVELEPKVVVSGWPRIDLWRQDLKSVYCSAIKDIKSKYGEFFIFSSDFGYTSIDRIEFVAVQSRKKGWGDERIQAFKSKALRELGEYMKFLRFLKEYSNYSGLPKLIVRPHPAEDHGAWLKDTKNINNIEVVFEGEITPWVYASLGVIHRGCTTGVQAYISNINSYCWVGGGKFLRKDLLSYKVSQKFVDVKEFISIVNNVYEIREKDFMNLDDAEIEMKRDELSVDVIVRELLGLKTKKEMTIKLTLLNNILSKIGNFIYRKRYKVNFFVDGNRRSRFMNKFGVAISFDEIDDFLKSIPFSGGVSIRHLDVNLFELS